MIQKEPVAITGALAVVVQAAVTALLPRADVALHIALTTIIVSVVVMVARRFSFSENTIRDAGLDPAAVEARANDPDVPRCEA